MGRSFAARLIVPLTIAGAIIIAGGLLLDYELSRNRIISGLERNANAATDAAAQRLSEMNTGVESSVRLLGEALHTLPDEEGIENLLRSVLDSNPNIFGATLALAPDQSSRPEGHAPYLYRDDGRLRKVDLAQPGASPYWEEDWFERAVELGKPGWVEPYFDSRGGRTLMTTFSAPIYAGSIDEPGELIAVATADVALANLHEYLEGLRIDSSGFGFLLTRSGTLVGSPVGPIIMAPLTETLESLDPEADWQRWLAALNEGRALDTAVRCPRSSDGCRVRIRPVPGQAWSVGVVYSEEELLRPLRNYETRVLTVGAVMLLLLAIVVSLITRRLMRPLLGLAAASESIARGELDVKLPSNPGDDEVGQLVRAFDGMRQDLGTYIGQVEQDAAQRSRMAVELNAARDIQMAMLPQGGAAQELANQFELWARVRPARAVGGDLYSYQRYSDRLLFSIGDVSDKGIPAALFMSRAISLIQQWEIQPATVPPEVAMGQLNSVLSRDNENCMFLTLVLGVLDLQTLQLQFASGGHATPLLLRGGEIRSTGRMNGPALGLQGGIEYSQNSIQLRPGDRLVLFTDGFDEAINSGGEMLGDEKLQTLLQKVADQPPGVAGPAVFDAIDRYSKGEAQYDDMTLVLLEIPKPVVPLSNEKPLQVEYTDLPLDADVLAHALRWLDEEWSRQELWWAGGQDLKLVLEEVVCNVRDHSGLPVGTHIKLSLERYTDHVCLNCADTAPAYNPLEDAARATLGTPTQDAQVGGLGVHLITSLTQAQSYRRESGRNILQLRLNMMGTSPGTDGAAT